ncbi:MAG: glutamate--tRNA ligase [Bacilli bacterium]
MMTKVRVRYAPSPTGQLHIGGARTALFNYLFAKHHGGRFIVRIEDTDIERNIEGGEASQIENLAWLGIHPDESPVNPGTYGPYRQMERLDIYAKYTAQLLEAGHAYKCFCTSEELEADKEAQMASGAAFPQYSGKCRHLTTEEVAANEAAGKPFTVRVRVPENKVYAFTDLVRGAVEFKSEDIGDWVLVKANGIPTYNYAVVIDDATMEISHVFRGEEHLTNTPKQLMIYEMLGLATPQFGHMTLIVNEQRKKLSKRDESIIQFVAQYRDLGYLPEAMFNFFALLGWSPEGDEEKFTHDELVAQFNVARLSKSPSMFDKAKLTWLNNRYIKDTSLETAISIARPHLEREGLVPSVQSATDAVNQWTEDLIALFKDQMSYGAEIVALSSVFFKDKLEVDGEAQELLDEAKANGVLAAFAQAIETAETFSPEVVSAAMKQTQKETGQKGKKLFMPIRIATTGQMHGPDLAKAIVLIGKEKVLARLK